MRSDLIPQTVRNKAGYHKNTESSTADPRGHLDNVGSCTEKCVPNGSTCGI